MGQKYFEYKWVKGKRVFHSIKGVKEAFAMDLIIMEDVKLSKKDYQYYDIKDVMDLTNKQAVQILESKGWKWLKLTAEEKLAVN